MCFYHAHLFPCLAILQSLPKYRLPSFMHFFSIKHYVDAVAHNILQPRIGHKQIQCESKVLIKLGALGP
jgi:hypothetical protein